MGRPASGKSTLAKRVENFLRNDGLSIENIDGDEIRKNLHPELSFTKEDRMTNNRRTAYICKLLNRNNISVVNAMITPFRESQLQARDIIEPEGRFVLIYVKCSVEEAKRRDPKNLYRQAIEGDLDNFTGISHPFEEPHDPEIIVNTESLNESQSVDHILKRLREMGLLDTSVGTNYGVDLTMGELKSIQDRLSDLGYELDTREQ
jgi:adenylylsulfate kinase